MPKRAMGHRDSERMIADATEQIRNRRQDNACTGRIHRLSECDIIEKSSSKGIQKYILPGLRNNLDRKAGNLTSRKPALTLEIADQGSI